MLRILLGLAHNDLEDLAILSEVVVAAQGLEELFFANRGCEAGNVYEVLLYDAETGEVLAAKGVGFRFLCFLLPYLRILLSLLRDLLLVLGHSVRC
jgi:hypothetical protein